MKAIGLNKSNATFWKRGSIPKGDTLQKLADYFGVSVDYLLGKAETPVPKQNPTPQKEDLMAAFFGGGQDFTPEEWNAMWHDVENFVAFVMERKKKEKARQEPPQSVPASPEGKDTALGPDGTEPPDSREE